MSTRVYVNATYSKRAAAGLCIRCGVTPRSKPGVCQPCRDKENIETRDRHKIREEMGLCISCGRVPPEDVKHLLCKECGTRNTNARKQLKQSRLEQGLCTGCGGPPTPGCKSCVNCRKKPSFSRDYTRAAVILKYSPGGVCQCCGESDRRLLTIDHVNNDGAEHRKTVSSAHLVGWLRKNNFPEGFQVLCFNCNMGKSANGGVCPHECPDFPAPVTLPTEAAEIIYSGKDPAFITRDLQRLQANARRAGKPARPPKRIPDRVPCPHCGAADTIKAGLERKARTKQKRQCNECKKYWLTLLEEEESRNSN